VTITTQILMIQMHICNFMSDFWNQSSILKESRQNCSRILRESAVESPEYHNSEKLRRVFLCWLPPSRWPNANVRVVESWKWLAESIAEVRRTIRGGKFLKSTFRNLPQFTTIRSEVRTMQLFRFSWCDFSRACPYSSRHLEPRRTPTTSFAVTERVQKFANDPVDLHLINFRDSLFLFST